MEERLFVISHSNMSKVASKPVELSSDIKFNVTDNIIHIEGPKGKLEFVKPNNVTVEQTENLLNVSTKSESTAMSGTTRALISNMVTGVSKGWEKKLLLVGVHIFLSHLNLKHHVLFRLLLFYFLYLSFF